MNRDALKMSPHQVDPLSWITRPWVSVLFALSALIYGLGTTLATWSIAPRPWLDLLASLLVIAACLWVQFANRPLKPRFTPARASVALVFGLAGLAVSTFAAMGSAVPVNYWWAPSGLGIILATCAVYSTAIEVACYGAVFVGATIIAAFFPYAFHGDVWSPVGAEVIAVSSVVVGATAAVVFSYVFVARTQQLLRQAGVASASDDAAKELAARRAEVTTLARLGSRVAPFLEAVAVAGEVTEADRALAGQLARRLRAQLVAQANTSWLDTVASLGRIYVVDPDHRAGALNTPQRAMLRGLIDAVVNDPSTQAGSLFIELRGGEDGSTAVALSVDLNLPEGRRMMMIAPYYLALTTTVNEFSWDPSRDLLQFRVQPKGLAPKGVAPKGVPPKGVAPKKKRRP